MNARIGEKAPPQVPSFDPNLGCLAIDLNLGARVLFDAVDAERVSERRWYCYDNALSNTQYAVANRLSAVGSTIMHRWLLNVDREFVVDHINGNGLDNRRSNLRVCTQLQNSRSHVNYVTKRRSGGEFVGVSWSKHCQLWRAVIHAGAVTARGDRAQIHLGLFDAPEKAAAAYDFAARKAFGEFAAPNFPDLILDAPPKRVPSRRERAKVDLGPLKQLVAMKTRGAKSKGNK